MPKLAFFPMGNADPLLIDLAGGEKILFDYARRRKSGARAERPHAPDRDRETGSAE